MTTVRKNFLSILPLLTLIPLASQAQPFVTNNAAAATIAIDCGHRYINQRDASRIPQTDNFSQTCAKRQSLYANVTRHCQCGVDEVLLAAIERQPKTRTIASR